MQLDVQVASAQKDMLEPRLAILAELWAAGIKAETEYKPNPKIMSQIQACEDRKIPFMVTIGGDELAANVVTV